MANMLHASLKTCVFTFGEYNKDIMAGFKQYQ